MTTAPTAIIADTRAGVSRSMLRAGKRPSPMQRAREHTHNVRYENV